MAVKASRSEPAQDRATFKIYWNGRELKGMTADFGGGAVELWGDKPSRPHQLVTVHISGDVPITAGDGPIEVVASRLVPIGLRQRSVELATVALMAYGDGARCRGGRRGKVFGIRFAKER